jgi:hypothetical protein
VGKRGTMPSRRKVAKIGIASTTYMTASTAPIALKKASGRSVR